MHTLNPQQRQAVSLTDRHTLVLAGAGSGKTRVITEKIAHLLTRKQIDPQRIIAVTFTNKAANEMRSRVAALLGRQQAVELQVSTFHTLGLNILRRECRKLGYRPGFTILGTDDVQTVLQQLLQSNNYAYSGDAAAAAWQISGIKNSLTDPATALQQAGDAQAQAVALLYAAYQQQIKAYNAVDFDDLLLQPVQLLQTDAEAREHWQGKARYLLVDEYQDTNAVQYELVKLLLGEYGKLTAVGDDDQSIYAWRGARPENMQKLITDLPDLQVIKLEQNYRSTGRILKCANQLIANNPHHFEKKLWSELGYGDPIKVLACLDTEDEAEQVVAEILHLKFQKSSRFRDFAILYRGNHQSRPFESALRMHNIPYKLSGGTAFFERAEIKDLLAYLRLIANPDDDAALLRIINTPRREIGAATLDKIAARAGREHCSLLTAIFQADVEPEIVKAARTRLAQFADWLRELQRAASEQNAAQILQRIIDDIDYRNWLRDTGKDKASADARLKNVDELLDWVRLLNQRQEQPLTVEELTAKLSLMDILERQEEDRDSDAVQLLTLHAAKGLEFPYVYLTGFEEGVLPHHSSEADEAVHEERRLAYVGITRAQKLLNISHARQRKKQGDMAACAPSRFLTELPADDLVWNNKDTGNSTEKLERGNANLSSLRNLLGNNG
jgi:ATP-dependent DNA helicase Rep